jgi:hypothetical protein
MTEPERENIFYVSARSQKGFTMDPAQAMIDLTGAPVIAPGHVKNILEKQDRRYMRSLDVQRQAVKRIWDSLMDTMESSLTAQDLGDLERQKCLDNKALGFLTSLAILEYGHDYKQDPEATLEKVAEMARVRYDQESE